ncbi:MAG: caspase family protein [Microscillaceae bacterium]|nr:caspase family protein [Microscillaceae bacterium]
MLKLTFLIICFVLLIYDSQAQPRYLVFDDQFVDNRHDWYPLGDRARTNAAIQNGTFYLESKRANYNYSRRIEAGYLRKEQDFEIEIRLRQLFGTDLRGFGLEWGGNSLDNIFYEFWLRNDAYFSIDQFNGTTGVFKDYVSWKQTPLIRISEYNTLRVLKIKQKLSFFINDQEVFQMPAVELNGYEIGFIAPPLSAIEVDYLRVYLINQAPQPVFSSENIPNIWVIITGIADYKNNNLLSDLIFTVKDARSMAEFYQHPNGGGVPKEHMQILINEQAGRENILLTLSNTFAKAQENDLVVFYFSGHGIAPEEAGEQVHLIPYDFDEVNLSTAIHYKEIENIFDRCRANKKLWIMDACHSGSVGEQLSKKKRELRTYLNEIMNVAFLTSANAGEESLEVEKLGRGLFSYYLTKGLIEDALEVDTDGDRFVSIMELYQYVKTQTSKEAPNHRSGHRQTPQILGTVPLKLPLSEVKSVKKNDE